MASLHQRPGLRLLLEERQPGGVPASPAPAPREPPCASTLPTWAAGGNLDQDPQQALRLINSRPAKLAEIRSRTGYGTSPQVIT